MLNIGTLYMFKLYINGVPRNEIGAPFIPNLCSWSKPVFLDNPK